MRLPTGAATHGEHRLLDNRIDDMGAVGTPHGKKRPSRWHRGLHSAARDASGLPHYWEIPTMAHFTSIGAACAYKRRAVGVRPRQVRLPSEPARSGRAMPAGMFAPFVGPALRRLPSPSRRSRRRDRQGGQLPREESSHGNVESLPSARRLPAARRRQALRGESKPVAPNMPQPLQRKSRRASSCTRRPGLHTGL